MAKKILWSVTVILSIVSLFVGVSDISTFNIGAEELEILLISRVPRLLSILIAGIGMSVSGVIMQQIGNNKFISPSTAGTIDSAKFGILLSLIVFTNVNVFEKMILAFICAVAGTLIFMMILKKIKVKNVVFIPLIGIMLGNVIGSITEFFAYKYNLNQNMTAFSQGSFSSILKGNYEILYLSIPLVIVAFAYVNKFTLAGMGEEMSVSLGLNYKKIANLGVVIVALVSALVVITAGEIPFVGLVIPNIISIWKGDNLKNNISLIALLGASFLLVCDIISRLLIFPYEIPINLTVGVIGAVIFLYLLFRRDK